MESGKECDNSAGEVGHMDHEDLVARFVVIDVIRGRMLAAMLGDDSFRAGLLEMIDARLQGDPASVSWFLEVLAEPGERQVMRDQPQTEKELRARLSRCAALIRPAASSVGARDAAAAVGKRVRLTADGMGELMSRGSSDADPRIVARYQAKARRISQISNPIVLGNQGLSRRNASLYRLQPGNSTQEEDLIQVGLLAVMRAIEKFDFRLGHRFSTYATSWIKSSMARSYRRANQVVALPQGRDEARRQLHRLLGGCDYRQVDAATIQWLAQQSGRTPREVRELLSMVSIDLSLDQPCGSADDDSGDLRIVDTLEDEDDGLEDEVESHLLSLAMEEALYELSDLDQEIVCRRYGLRGHQATPFSGIGEAVGSSREFVRRRCEVSVAKLAASASLNRYIDHEHWAENVA
ncbi:MAG: sigma-70 family RNA polymerase sigma factor [Salinisphaeraceae bacterium]